MVEVVQAAAWARYEWLRHGFSTRLGGVSESYGGRSLNVGWTKEDDPAAVAKNRALLMEAVGGSERAITLRQVHGMQVLAVDGKNLAGFEDERGRAVLEGDGLMTDVPGVLLGIQTADCVPVILVDAARRAVAVLHAGWRGTAAGMVVCGLEAMRREYGTSVDDLAAAVGPAIGVCCYAVGDEVRAAFEDRFDHAADLFAGDRLDLWEANRRQLVDAGVAPERVTTMGECTGCARTPEGDRKYFSHRMDGGVTGRMMSVVGVV